LHGVLHHLVSQFQLLVQLFLLLISLTLLDAGLVVLLVHDSSVLLFLPLGVDTMEAALDHLQRKLGGAELLMDSMSSRLGLLKRRNQVLLGHGRQILFSRNLGAHHDGEDQ